MTTSLTKTGKGNCCFSRRVELMKLYTFCNYTCRSNRQRQVKEKYLAVNSKAKTIFSLTITKLVLLILSGVSGVDVVLMRIAFAAWLEQSVSGAGVIGNLLAWRSGLWSLATAGFYQLKESFILSDQYFTLTPLIKYMLQINMILEQFLFPKQNGYKNYFLENWKQQKNI